MARACTHCGRPNGDTAKRCLYCSRPLTELETLPAETPAADIARNDRRLVILFPSGAPDEARIAAFSAITGLGRYESRQLLLTQRPRLFRRLSEEHARTLSTSLVEARIPHYVTAEESVLSLPISRAKGVTFRERHLELDLEGSPVSILNDDLLLIVHGEITRERYNDKRIGSTKRASHRLTPGERLHLYPREAAVAVEIEPESFDFAVLGERLTSSSLLNVQRLVSLLTDRGARIDRSFGDEPVVLTRASRSEDPSQALAEGERGPAGVIWDNENQFRYYSRWRYRLERYLSRV